ncbi:MAG: hypothetical protein CO030_02580 [Candidatus Magasanikbacteria bacterium CG_4_9_14_0_2_um_filter_42_11]|uniref:HMA domain-containing protein n=1 Tax=Candidatus Magasanikbacteria bacterium CG_4_9_14_0_2_um_filter_42_11 TaxID=1974643 RepID=A0A2M8F9T0_9BACT|nr:MAG: hypothetical protein CO030_02580 [Candidatus Magasanikbacteria bacterium CG_4_9_14_0_2_um_filter_42_11]
MHCDACKKLIQMELDDAGFGDALVGVTLKPENVGELQLAENLSAEDKEKVIASINSMENYKVIT